MKTEKQPTKFPGFSPKGQYWQFPVIVDGFVKTLTPAEFKVLFYILRQTYGWQKQEDFVSLSLIQRYTGISRTGVIKAVRGLESKGFFVVDRSRKINKYTPLVNRVDQTSKQRLPAVSKQSAHTIDSSTIDNFTIPLQKISDDERQQNLKELEKVRAHLKGKWVLKKLKVSNGDTLGQGISTGDTTLEK